MMFANQGRWKLREDVHHVWETYELCSSPKIFLCAHSFYSVDEFFACTDDMYY